MPVKEQIYQLTLPTPYAVGDVHVYVVKGEALTLIDAGVNTDEAWEHFETKLKQIGYRPEDIEQIILTHHHPDHTGLVNRFDYADGIYAHHLVDQWLRRDPEFMNHYVAFFTELYHSFGVPKEFISLERRAKTTLRLSGRGKLTDTLKEGDSLPGHPNWKVLETPGHAQSHLSFFNEHTGELLGGDHILYHISSNPLLEPPIKPGGERPKPMLQYRESMQRFNHYTVGKVFPGHGKVFEGVENLINQRIKKQEERAEKVYQMIQQQPLSPFEICKRLFPKQYDTQFDLTLSETVGQLDFLEAQGKVKQVTEDEHILYAVS
ncbi:glyoxylase-like metal-dependent hydrolase (beta-lactamase superfamily II) [Melghiribacillus thermohalophilus]|uniref:Glyoxylase-like metal-dependent hydrolase (Beta-lactamase superfamily II) n=1 Tax=Melghiribacillus thermohalophilus TaxID=1324956 RepID=A0A4R3NEL6_9BACI|nr:MBL fold metallo-hydrolase [Melghiribacillus thermohalophilus]TCT25662.1 glyoxylase-like metal-dependent hydrolase (beta-lactamase superfamily II) [Melghiribacillus thermohalophilus]